MEQFTNTRGTRRQQPQQLLPPRPEDQRQELEAPQQKPQLPSNSWWNANDSALDLPGSGSTLQPQAAAAAPPRTSFKQQAHELQLQRHQQMQARPAGVASSTKLQAPLLAQQDAQQQQQQQAVPPPTQSLEEAMGHLQLKTSLAASAAAAAATPGLKMRSRGLLTPVSTPRAAAAAEGSRTAPVLAGTPLALEAQLTPPAASEEQQQQLWSPMLPAPGPALAAQGAGVLGTLSKAPRGAPAPGASSAAASGRQAAPVPGGAPQPAAGPRTPHRGYGGLADGPAEVRRQLQAIAPELTLTQLPAAVPAAGAAPAAARAQRPAGVADRAAAQELLARMHQLQAAAAGLLQEQAAGSRCRAAVADFRGLAALGPAANQGSSGASATTERQQRITGPAEPGVQKGPSPAVAQRLAQLRKLQAQGAALAAGVA
ncbi:hypothetical protein ABPG77_005624 [Micractinium sp. CCAP 211/92]